MREKIFIDTSSFAMFLHANEDVKKKITDKFLQLERQGYQFFTSDYVLDELMTLLRCRQKASVKLIKRFVMEIVMSTVTICSISEREFAKALNIFRKYEDKFLSFTDCVCFQVMKDMKIKSVLSQDKHFEVMGFKRFSI